ncbi:MAG: hypothetical protein AB7U98_00255 [Candidatus Nitrosocosmicus sp.]
MGSNRARQKKGQILSLNISKTELNALTTISLSERKLQTKTNDELVKHVC